MGIDDLVKEILSVYKQKVGSSNLADTATYTVEWNGDIFEVYFNLQDYWKYVEEGTRPHFPPVDAIERWITAKRIVPRAYNGQVPTTRQLAYVISRSISRKGTEGKHYLSDTLEECTNLINLIVEELSNQFEVEINNTIVEL